MAVRRMPFVTVLNAMMLTLLAGNLPTVLGAPELLIRWRRNRYTSNEERPCIALAFVSDGPSERTDQYASAGEMIRELAVDVIADVELPTEVEAEQFELDVARVEILGAYLLEAVKVLKDSFRSDLETRTPLSGVAQWVEEIGIDDDEDLADENGRLVCRLNVLYRVRSEDPTVLLMTE